MSHKSHKRQYKKQKTRGKFSRKNKKYSRKNIMRGGTINEIVESIQNMYENKQVIKGGKMYSTWRERMLARPFSHKEWRIVKLTSDVRMVKDWKYSDVMNRVITAEIMGRNEMNKAIENYTEKCQTEKDANKNDKKNFAGVTQWTGCTIEPKDEIINEYIDGKKTKTDNIVYSQAEFKTKHENENKNNKKYDKLSSEDPTQSPIFITYAFGEFNCDIDSDIINNTTFKFDGKNVTATEPATPTSGNGNETGANGNSNQTGENGNSDKTGTGNG